MPDKHKRRREEEEEEMVTNHDSVRVHDGVEAMRYRQNGAVLELEPNGFLDQSIGAENEKKNE